MQKQIEYDRCLPPTDACATPVVLTTAGQQCGAQWRHSRAAAGHRWQAAAVSQLLLAGLGANFKKHNLDCSKFEGQRDFKV